MNENNGIVEGIEKMSPNSFRGSRIWMFSWCNSGN